MRLVPLAAIFFLLAACQQNGVGTSCERKGDSFLARHNCNNICLAWPVTCGDGTQVATPNVCSGMQDCSLNKPCPGGQVCALSGGNNYCVPISICPSGIPANQPSSAELLQKINKLKAGKHPKVTKP